MKQIKSTTQSQEHAPLGRRARPRGPASPERRSLASRIAIIEGWHGPADPRLPALRAQLVSIRAVEDLRAWAERARAELPPFGQDEIEAVVAIAAKLDQRRLSQQQAS